MIVAGAKLLVVPAGRPETESAIGFVKLPPTPVAAMVNCATDPPATVNDCGVPVSEKFATEDVPVPVSVTVCGEPVALSATESVAVKLAADAGVKVTEIVHVDDAASVLPQLFAEIAKSVGLAPPMLTLLMVREALPVLERVMFCAVAVVPTGVFVKGTVDGLSPAMGADAGVPVPLTVNESACVWMEAELLAVEVMLPV